MAVFSNFYFATIAILLAVLSISLPVLFFLRIYSIISEPYINKYSDVKGFEDRFEVVIELLLEFKNYLEKNEDYEKAKEVHQTYLQFQKRKITIERIFNQFEIMFEEVENGDLRINPEREAVIIDSYSYTDEENDSVKVTKYGYLKFKKSLTVKEFIKKFLFS